MTPEQRRRVERAMSETQSGLARAMRYSPEFRDNDLIAFYHRHIAKLTDILEGRRELATVSFGGKDS